MENTAKNFALQLGSLVTLYVSIGALIGLLFGIITVQYPDQAQMYWEYNDATSSIRFSIALLIVFFPTYIILTRLVNVIRRTEQGTYLTLTRWLIYLSLLVGGGVLLGDLVATFNSFLNGEITIRFALKALTVLLVTGVAFVYYLMDVRGYWQANERHSQYYGGIVALTVVVSLISGFMHTETPGEVRDMNLDAKQITDLQDMQYRVQAYASLHEALPKSLSDAYSGLQLPMAPEGRAMYRYEVISYNSFNLCAEFFTETKPGENALYGYDYTEPFSIKNPDDWSHGKGEWCFMRVLNTDKTILD